MAALNAGRLLARRYRLLDRIGAGGMSVIWRARDEVLDRVVAVKVLAPSLAADARFRDMVREEARSAAQLVHPHVTAVHDYGEALAPDGEITSFVVMELLTGEELEHRLSEGPLPWPEAVEVGAQVAEALAAAHRLGIVHRDITPANVMMTRIGAKVLDFGIATQVGTPDDDEDGGTFGTPAYVAPERLDGAPAQPSTDVYSLGVLLYETLTGQPPYPAETWEQLATAIADERPPVLDGVPGLPPVVVDVCLRCLARDPHERPTAHQVATALRDQLLPGDPQAATMLAPTVTLPAVPGADAPGDRPTTPAAGTGPAVVGAAAGGAAAGGGSVADAGEAGGATAGPGDGDAATGRAGVGGAVGGRAAATATLDTGTSGARHGRHGGPDGDGPEPELLPPSRRPLVAVGVLVVLTAAAVLLLAPLLEPGTHTPPVAGRSETPVTEPSPSRTQPAAEPTPPPAPRRATTAPAPSRPPVTTPGGGQGGGGLTEAADRMRRLIDDGVRTGEVREDVGLDLRNVLANLTRSAAEGRSDVPAQVTALREKVTRRVDEGGITPAYGRQLDAAVRDLAATTV
ncbi:serine/threonine-protein kinase [Micromonospora sp. HUAS LYJ1]|uniref:serine/threonine-protein kinase n=1 Tax=Micromonospora sp. HUAS LYJ1 TaxID=3061626 RepID=UPI00267391D4|nr:serine/threonine-protein kinase [Micromonospora sp. HUAS LYJ1]WKU08188.1 serine/threonine-protein kinase [Micromonospora sp. HUAS LYJ1]